MADFLSEAVAATRRELGVTSAEALARGSRSGVIDVPERERVSLRPARGKTLGLVVLAGLVLVGGIAFAIAGPNLSGGVRVLVIAGAITIAVLALIVAVVLLVVAAMQATRTAAGIPERRPPVPPSFRRGEVVAIEPAATYGRFKLVGDDLGVLYHDPAGRRLLIDGSAHRYLIADADVTACEVGSVRLGSGVRFDLTVGARPLSIVIAKLADPPEGEMPEAARAPADDDDADQGSVDDDGPEEDVELDPDRYDVRKQFRRRLLATLGRADGSPTQSAQDA